MKAPKYFVATMQDASDVRLNPFAFQLMAESFSDDPDRFGDENVVLRSVDHKGREVYFIITKTMPTAKDFDPAEESQQEKKP